MTALIKANNLTLKQGQKSILDKVSLEVDSKDFITLIGPNGAGKTLLLRTLLGLMDADEGTVTRNPKARIGYMPQTLTLPTTLPMKVSDFLDLKKNITLHNCDEVITETNIQTLLNKQLHHLSGGEKQRVLLAFALLGDPDLLVLDEPAQSLDIAAQLALYALLDKIYAKGKCAILMVSHDLHFVMSSTKRVVCLYHHICCAGPPQQIGNDPAFIALFGKGAQELLAAYPHHHDHVH